MVTITLYARQKKRHRCTEQTFGLYGRRRGWDDLREQHRNMYTIKCETDRQFRLDAWDKCSGLVHWDDPEGWMGRQVGGGLRMGNTCKCVESWLIHVNVWQKPLQYCKVISLQLINIIGKKKKTNLPANAGDTGSVLAWEDPTCTRATKLMHHKYWACALEPKSRNFWVHMLQLLKLEWPRARVLQ